MGYPLYNSRKERQNADHERTLARAIRNDSLGRFFKGRDIPLLPGTKKEVESIREMLDETNLKAYPYLGPESTESTVKSWRNPKIVHIATHGYFLKDKDLAQNREQINGVEKEALMDNPLLRSGLLFTNAKQAFEEGGDGILTAYEARDLHLDETELVVLSACETGLGEVRNGEGVYGLQRSVIMSLWTVDDQATQELMTEFYRSWLIEGNKKREAFRNAKMAIKAKYEKPFYWSAFVMIGD